LQLAGAAVYGKPPAPAPDRHPLVIAQSRTSCGGVRWSDLVGRRVEL